MNNKLRLLLGGVLLLMLASCTSPGGEDGTTGPILGPQLLQMKSGGVERSYWLQLPAKPNLRPRPLMIVLHGTGSNGESMLQLGAFSTQATNKDYLLAAPNSLGRAFNDGSGRIGAEFMSVDDVLFVHDLIAKIKAQYQVARVFVVGFSSGAAMAQRLGLQLSNEIDGVAGASGHLWQPFLSAVPADLRPVPLLLIFGDSDPLNPMTGGAVRYGADLVIDKAPPSRTAQRWARLYHCATSVSASAHKVRSTTWYGCDGSVPLKFITVRGLGHFWSGGPVTRYESLPESVVGKYADGIDTTGFIWDFFSAPSNR